MAGQAVQVRKMQVVISAKDMFSRPLTAAQAQFKRFSSKVGSSIKTGFTVGAKAVAILSAAVIAVKGALFMLVNSTANAGDAIDKMSLRLGISAQKLSEYKHVAEISGTSLSSFENAIRVMSKRMLDSKNGLTTASRSFDALGISVTDANGNLRKNEVVFEDAMIALRNLKSDTEKVALAQELFGRSGTQLLPLVKAGAQSVEELRKEARELGITFDSVAAKQSADFVDSMTRVKGSFTGIKNAIANEFMPTFTQMAEDLQEKVKGWLPVVKRFAGHFKIMIINVPEILSLALDTSQELLIKFFSDYSYFESFLLNFTKLIFSMVQGFGDKLTEMTKIVLKVSSVIWVPLGETFSVLGSNIRFGWQILVNNMSEMMVKAALYTVDKLNVILPKSWEFDTTGLKNILKEIDKEVIKPPKTMAEAWKEGGATIRGLIGSVSENVKNIKDSFVSTFDGVKTAATSFVNSPEMQDLLNKIRALGQPQKKKIVVTAAEVQNDENRSPIAAVQQQVNAEKKLQALMKKRPEIITNNVTVAELSEYESMQKRLAQITEYYDQKLMLASEAGRSEEEIIWFASKRALAIETQTNHMRIAGAIATSSMMANTLQSLYVATGKRQKALFYAYKAFAVAQAIISAHLGAAKAPAQAGIYGIPLASVILAMGYANAAAIAATALSGGGGGSVGGGSIGGGGSGFPQTGASGTARISGGDVESRPSLTIHLNIEGVISPETLDEVVENNLIPAINRAGERDVQINANVISTAE